jgi:oligopeptide transport system ATP-binding protein
MTAPLLEIRNLQVAFPLWGGLFRHKVGEVRAVDGVSLTIHRGETLGLVGESGCGKTTVAQAIVRILRTTAPGVHVAGELIFYSDSGPVDLLQLTRGPLRPLRRQIQMVFQDPFSSLNPRMTVGQLMEIPLRLHTDLRHKERAVRIAELLNRVGLQPEYVNRYPHEFSAGQRQRIGIARALAVEPQLIVLDEPVSALDVSVQAQVVNLLQDLQDELGLTYLFVAHDLSVVYHISTQIAVMYLGKLVEIGDSETVYHRPAHPYVRALLSAVPHPDPHYDYSGETRLQGEVPSPVSKPAGCAFRSRCSIARDACATFTPALEPHRTGQLVACPFAELTSVGSANQSTQKTTGN